MMGPKPYIVSCDVRCLDRKKCNAPDCQKLICMKHRYTGERYIAQDGTRWHLCSRVCAIKMPAPPRPKPRPQKCLNCGHSTDPQKNKDFCVRCLSPLHDKASLANKPLRPEYSSAMDLMPFHDGRSPPNDAAQEQIFCLKCSQKIQIPASALLGSRMLCPNCGEQIVL